MKTFIVAAIIAAFTAAPALAQEAPIDHPNGYVSAFGGPAWAGGNSTGTVLFEGGVRVMRHLMVFGNVGRFANLATDLQPTLATTTNTLTSEGLGVTTTASLPAWYGVAGLRGEMRASRHALPYALGGIGVARLSPTAQFTYASGLMPDGSTPAVGDDVTTTLTGTGNVTVPAPSSAMMVMLGGGVQVPIVSHWAADVGYRYSRIAADSTLNATSLNTNVVTFGFGYRF